MNNFNPIGLTTHSHPATNTQRKQPNQGHGNKYFTFISEDTKKATNEKINKEISIIREKIDELTKMGISYEEVIERIKK